MKIIYDGHCRLTRGYGAPFGEKSGEVELMADAKTPLPFQDVSIEIVDAGENRATLAVNHGDNRILASTPYNEKVSLVLERDALAIHIDITPIR